MEIDLGICVMKATSPPRSPRFPDEALVPWISIGATVLAIFALLFALTVSVGAQDAPPPPPPGQINFNDPAFREEAVRMHRERVANLMQQEREQREREQLRQSREGGEAEGDMSEGERARAEAAEAQILQTTDRAETPAALTAGSVELLSTPLNWGGEVGDTLVTGISLHNTLGAQVTGLRLALRYDPLTLRPLRVSDGPVQDLLPESGGLLTADLERGLIWYEADLERSPSSINAEILTLEWQCLVPAPRTRILIEGIDEGGTAILSRGRNLLAMHDQEGDGLIGTELNIRPVGTGDIRGTVLMNNEESFRAVQGVDPQGGVTLSLVPSGETLLAGDTLPVNLVLENPAETPIDDLRVAIEFDPTIFEALDAAPSDSRRAGQNWIVSGINLHDAPFQERFPFDLHLRNEVNRDLGLAIYHMGLSEARPLPGGVFARLYLRVLEPSEATALAFRHSATDRLATTRVSCLGIDLLGELDTPEDGTANLTLAVPAPERPTETAALTATD